jgi:hypothetical protein
MTIFQIRDFMNLEGQVPLVYFVSSYDSQKYGGGIHARLHAVSSSSDLTENTLRHRYKVQSVTLFGETVAVYCKNHTEHTNALCGQNAGF